MITNICFSQGVGINSDNTDPDAKAMLDIKATGQGLLIPRMKYADRPTPLTNNDYHKGMIIYATDGNGTDGPGFYYWDGTQWLIVGTGSGSVRWNEILPPNGNTSIAHNLYTTNFTFTGTTTDAFTMTNNSLTSGKIFSLTSTATGMTGSIANISLTGNNASNTGNLLYINSSGASTLAKALNINIASTNNLGNAVGSGGGIRFYFSGAHTGNGFQIDDATTSGTAMAINVNAITTGTGLNISSNSNSTTNSNKLLHVNRTGAISGGGNSIYGVYSEVSATSASGHNYAI